MIDRARARPHPRARSRRGGWPRSPRASASRTAGSGARARASSGPSLRSIAAAQATAVSTVSQGRQTSMPGSGAGWTTCSTDWCVGPSSPRPMESCVKTKMLRALHQRRHAQGVARVVGEREEGAGVGDEAAVQREAVADRGHAELAHAEVDVVAGLLSRSTGFEPDQLVRLEPVRSAEPPSSSGSSGASASIACCEALRVATVSAFSIGASRCSASTVAVQSAGSSPAMRRRNSRAALGMRAARTRRSARSIPLRAPRRARARPRPR